jgi:two-component system KDP operon response regulator KdpE
MLRRRALIVEDDEELRRLFTVGLKFEGYDVVEAADGLAALRQLDYHAPDVVVLDLGLPHVNGVAVLQEIAAHAITR